MVSKGLVKISGSETFTRWLVRSPSLPQRRICVALYMHGAIYAWCRIRGAVYAWCCICMVPYTHGAVYAWCRIRMVLYMHGTICTWCHICIALYMWCRIHMAPPHLWASLGVPTTSVGQGLLSSLTADSPHSQWEVGVMHNNGYVLGTPLLLSPLAPYLLPSLPSLPMDQAKVVSNIHREVSFGIPTTCESNF